jgi:hypothetical protein
MNDRKIAEMHGEVVQMIAVEGFLYVAVLHLGKTVVYEVDTSI